MLPICVPSPFTTPQPCSLPQAPVALQRPTTSEVLTTYGVATIPPDAYPGSLLLPAQFHGIRNRNRASAPTRLGLCPCACPRTQISSRCGRGRAGSLKDLKWHAGQVRAGGEVCAGAQGWGGGGG